jgi:hypothetical protein
MMTTTLTSTTNTPHNNNPNIHNDDTARDPQFSAAAMMLQAQIKP